MPGTYPNDHLRIAILTSATPAEVFATIRGLASARRASLDRLRDFGMPRVSTRPPRFTIRAPIQGRHAPVGWSGTVSAMPQGSLIVASTNRTAALWQAGVFIAVVVVGSLLRGVNGDSDDTGLRWPVTIFCCIGAVVCWYRATHLSESARRDAFFLRDELLARLPNSSLVDPDRRAPTE